MKLTRWLSWYKDVFNSMRIVIMKIRRSYDCLIFIMKILIPGVTISILRWGPASHHSKTQQSLTVCVFLEISCAWDVIVSESWTRLLRNVVGQLLLFSLNHMVSIEISATNVWKMAISGVLVLLVIRSNVNVLMKNSINLPDTHDKSLNKNTFPMTSCLHDCPNWCVMIDAKDMDFNAELLICP